MHLWLSSRSHNLVQPPTVNFLPHPAINIEAKGEVLQGANPSVDRHPVRNTHHVGSNFTEAFVILRIPCSFLIHQKSSTQYTHNTVVTFLE